MNSPGKSSWEYRCTYEEFEEETRRLVASLASLSEEATKEAWRKYSLRFVKMQGSVVQSEMARALYQHAAGKYLDRRMDFGFERAHGLETLPG